MSENLINVGPEIKLPPPNWPYVLPVNGLLHLPVVDSLGKKFGELVVNDEHASQIAVSGLRGVNPLLLHIEMDQNKIKVLRIGPKDNARPSTCLQCQAPIDLNKNPAGYCSFDCMEKAEGLSDIDD